MRSNVGVVLHSHRVENPCHELSSLYTTECTKPMCERDVCDVSKSVECFLIKNSSDIIPIRMRGQLTEYPSLLLYSEEFSDLTEAKLTFHRSYVEGFMIDLMLISL